MSIQNKVENLVLSEDIYCVTFVKFMDDEPLQHKELMLKSVIAFVFQIVLIVLITSFFVNKEDSESFMAIYTGSWKINSARLCCAFLLHMQILPEIRCAIDMIKYAQSNADKFYGKG